MTQPHSNRPADTGPLTGSAGDERDAHAALIPDPDWKLLYEDTQYCAYAEDLDFLWRWVILRHGEIVQEGCSLSLNTAERSVRHVLTFYALTRNCG